MPTTNVPLGSTGATTQTVTSNQLTKGVSYYHIEYRDAANDPWLINVLAIQPSRTTARLAYELPGGNNRGGSGETVSAAASRVGAIAGINAGFFSNVNVAGIASPARSSVGTTVVNGKLVGTAAGGRPGALIQTTSDGYPSVTILPDLTSKTTLTDAHNSSITVNQIDVPILGMVINCGAQARPPTPTPEQDTDCTNADDLRMYDSQYLHDESSNTQVDNNLTRLATYELVVDSTGYVVAGHTSLGAQAPEDGYVLQGLGSSAIWLQDHYSASTHLSVTSHLYSDGKEVTLTPGMTIVEAGPTLSVPGDNLLSNAWAEGFPKNPNGTDAGESTASDSGWYSGWVIGRNPRTAIGTAPDGTILLVEIDGRNGKISQGTTIPETAAVMRWLGATSAMNLDGGGSSNMVVVNNLVRHPTANSDSVGHPSDSTGERPVGGTFMIEAGN
ncbi:MAG: phosphodiester glycosidase family protein [Pseudomonadota bacterium]|jgi:hypothetical protein|uniref:phosphodiester glycosidase family protein n=1 Tax=Burkholderiaceae TaxID=119060 RepID=UPI0010F80F94|nr:phosphodiester glycosidase family protein [Burkholderia sp. 4M9327F10]